MAVFCFYFSPVSACWWRTRRGIIVDIYIIHALIQAVVCRVCDRPWGCGSYPGWGEAWHRHRRRFSPGVLIIDLGSRWRTIRSNRQNGF